MKMGFGEIYAKNKAMFEKSLKSKSGTQVFLIVLLYRFNAF